MNVPGVGRVPRRLVTLLVALVVAGIWWLVQGDGGEPTAGPSSTGPSSTGPSSTGPSSTGPSSTGPSPQDAGTETGGIDPESGLPWVDPSALPPEAREAIALIEQDGPYPYDEDDETFQNREGLLPDEPLGYYREYTVETPGSDDRGARRIVTGSAGEYYWTEDHYASFERIAR